ncbi:kinase-like domain-containing protein [Gloeopeniophorella convolvens]|nr:kinase-like domain-containing protein [Gloeopeniophorella convolvens]
MEHEGETQNATQQASQLAGAHPTESPFFGCLQPCNGALRRLDFQKTHPSNTLGRGPGNDYVLPGMRISFSHCQIVWDGREDARSQVVVQDNSTNGTWINGVRVQKGQSRILRDGNEIAFGSPMPQASAAEDYRYIYRHLAARELTGIHAHYDMAHELGKGSFATVMKAMARATGEWCAVKIIHGSKLRGSGAHFQAFGREISILETLDHRNICRLRETFVPEDGGHDFYLVLELVEGGDLLDYILKHDGLAEPVAQHVTRQMCDALAYIHAKGITHRDLKPENVLLTKEDPPTVKVADFGLAKVVDSLTMLKTMCGTPSYLAPEVVNQTEDSRGYDQLVDSWSVGVIVFSMITNTGPFIEDEHEPDMRRRIAERTIDWGTLRAKRVSPQAQDFIHRLLDANPRTRMTLTDALQHPWLSGASTDPATSTSDPAPTSAAADASQPRSLSELSDLSELPDADADADTDLPPITEDVSMLSAAPSLAPLSPDKRRPLERRSRVLAREAEHENDAAGGAGTGAANGKRAAPDDVAMAESGESDGAPAGGAPRAKRGRRAGGARESESPPSNGAGGGGGGGNGRTLRPRNGGAATRR